MHDLHKALADIGSIRQQLAAGTVFRGLGPSVIAATGGIALVTAVVQALWLPAPSADPLLFLAVWIGVALVAAGLIGVEMVTRSRRHHSWLADAMIWNAVEQFLPAGIAGAAIGLVVWRFAPDAFWMLPGLWQILIGLGLFASVRSLPPGVSIAAAWYLVAGIAVLLVGGQTKALSPWTMGLPFVVGQVLLAAILQHAFGGGHEQD